MNGTLDIFHTLSEVSVAITGFSSLIIIFRGSATPWSSHDYIHFGFVLAWSIGCIFLSLLPVLLAEFGIALHQSSRIGFITAIFYISILGGLLSRAQNAASRREGVSPPLRPRIVMTILVFSILAISLLSAVGFMPGPLQAWYALVIVSLLFVATADLGIFVVHSTRSADTD